MKDHSESIQVVFDTRKLSLQHLVKLFWEAHSPFQPGWGVQYKHAIYYTPEQKEVILQSAERLAASSGKTIKTEIKAFDPTMKWYNAEHYHQKYSLRRNLKIVKYLNLSDEELRESHEATRLNSWLGGHGNLESAKHEIETWTLDADAKEHILFVLGETMGRRHRFCA